MPHQPDVAPTDRIVTLTSCNPLYSTAERIIAYGVLESWQPELGRSAGRDRRTSSRPGGREHVRCPLARPPRTGVAARHPAAAIAAGVVFALFTWVFPWVDGIINPIDVTVEQ